MVEYEQSIKGKDVYKHHRIRVLQETLMQPPTIMNIEWIKDGDKTSKNTRWLAKRASKY